MTCLCSPLFQHPQSPNTTDISLTVPDKHHHLGNNPEGYPNWELQAQFMGSVLAWKYGTSKFKIIKSAIPILAQSQSSTVLSTITVYNNKHNNSAA